ncbi:MAG: NADH-quinone oxidoreductase subunit NuoE [Spirochaetales bacterium]|nr:NADH-quinone oxidoreductase subunit NuoE [Spirochaetales bacterium]
MSSTMAGTTAAPARYQEILRRYRPARDSLIPILQAVQEAEGYISKDSIYAISDYLGLPESKIFGVATFYNQFRLNPPGRCQIQICRGTACHVKGSFNLLEVLQQELGIEAGQTTRDGAFSLETVACLGACSIAPVMTVNGEFYGRLDKKALLRILADLKDQGPAEERADA